MRDALHTASGKLDRRELQVHASDIEESWAITDAADSGAAGRGGWVRWIHALQAIRMLGVADSWWPGAGQVRATLGSGHLECTGHRYIGMIPICSLPCVPTRTDAFEDYP